MRTLLVVASLWANADPAATNQPIGPWLGEQGRLLSKATADAKLRLDKWAASTHDCVFDIRVVSLGEEATGEVRFLVDPLNKPSTVPVALNREKAQAVQAILPHILAAGHAREEAQHTVTSAVGKPAMAARYVKTPITIVDGTGVARTGLTARQEGEQFQVTTGRVTFAATDFGVSIVPDRVMPFVAPQPTSKTNVYRANLQLGESMVLFRDAVPHTAQPVGSRVIQAAAVEPDPESPPAKLFIITPRRGPKMPSPPATFPPFRG